MKNNKHWQKPEEQQQVMAGLYSIRELMNNGMFQLDSETEDDMLDCGAIEVEVEEMRMCLDDAITLLEKEAKL